MMLCSFATDALVAYSSLAMHAALAMLAYNKLLQHAPLKGKLLMPMIHGLPCLYQSESE